jgi:hypothetical protein
VATQQFVVLSREPASDGSMAPIGDRADIVADLSVCNTSSDVPGGDVLFGPGIRIELTPGQDPVTQMLLSIDDEDIGWLVLMRLARRFEWKILDPNTGRELQP